MTTPHHYSQSPYQPVDVIDAWELNFNLGNTIKYICRHKHKSSPIEDLKKALYYLNREINTLEGKQ